MINSWFCVCKICALFFLKNIFGCKVTWFSLFFRGGILNYVNMMRNGEHFSQINHWHPNWFVLLFTVRLSVVLMRTYSSNYQWGREGTGFIKRWVLLYYWYYWWMRGKLNFLLAYLFVMLIKWRFSPKLQQFMCYISARL